MTYSTPGVYVEEISKFPPSVAQVETAIPAFIGYTQIAKNKLPGDLNLVPTRISSLLEYQTYFGFPQNELKISVDVNADNTIVVNAPVHADRSPFIMYYNLQMYFANGGGPCWITSVGQYDADLTTPATAVVFADLEKGLAEIRKIDEPTLLVFPDSTFLADESKFYEIYKAALTQCGELQDRFTILDTYTDAKSSIGDFRTGINSDPAFLKYGGAYYPYLKTILNYSYLDKDVVVNDPNAPAYNTQVATITNSIDTVPLRNLLAELVTLNQPLTVGATTAAQARATIIPITAKTEEILRSLSSIKSKLTAAKEVGVEAYDENLPPLPTPPGPDLVSLGTANGNLATYITALNAKETAITNLLTNLEALSVSGTKAQILAVVSDPLSGTIFESLGLNALPILPIDEQIDKLKVTNGELNELFLKLAPFSNLNADLSDYELNNNVMYNAIKAEIAKVSVVLPSSSAMAGVYARVDNLIGVWKAPANVGLNYVIAPSQLVSNEEQGDMNVTSTGKSINAIRSFTGKGTLVWGARTLTGNSNEWRYISVRRFFNMVEESVSEASEQFVFESNDANTWVRIRAMIENFLILQWKAGALAGAKPEQAFYVRIGLGQTMTAEDILNGYMIIEIGMAVVRPAEFIVLRFSHKMQEA